MNNIGQNIRRLLKINNFSIAEFSKSCGIGSATLSNILNGKSSPNSSTLIKIANQLHVSFTDLIQPIPELRTLRFRTRENLSAREKAIRDQLIINISLWLKNYVELEKILEDRHNYQFSDLQNCTTIEAAHKIRKEWRLNEEEPIQDIISLIESSGIKVLLQPFNLQKTFSFSIGKEDGGPAIIVNTDSSISLERKIFTVAHELGHLILHKNSYNKEISITENKQEQEADAFASELLVPQKSFEDKIKEYSGLTWIEAVLQIKRFYYVSYQTILYRLKNMPGRFQNNDEIYKEFNFLYKRYYNHDLKNHYEPNALTSEVAPALVEPDQLKNVTFIEDRYSRLVREALDQNLITISKAAEYLNLSLMEMRERQEQWI